MSLLKENIDNIISPEPRTVFVMLGWTCHNLGPDVVRATKRSWITSVHGRTVAEIEAYIYNDCVVRFELNLDTEIRAFGRYKQDVFEAYRSFKRRAKSCKIQIPESLTDIL